MTWRFQNCRDPVTRKGTQYKRSIKYIFFDTFNTLQYVLNTLNFDDQTRELCGSKTNLTIKGMDDLEIQGLSRPCHEERYSMWRYHKVLSLVAFFWQFWCFFTSLILETELWWLNKGTLQLKNKLLNKRYWWPEDFKTFEILPQGKECH